ncbi:hypothetical protein DM2_2109 [Halorubrum sp. DM2]|nr:hypothetical protein DM2_2109 [Halorubrum sp. DM2]
MAVRANADRAWKRKVETDTGGGAPVRPRRWRVPASGRPRRPRVSAARGSRWRLERSENRQRRGWGGVRCGRCAGRGSKGQSRGRSPPQ